MTFIWMLESLIVAPKEPHGGQIESLWGKRWMDRRTMLTHNDNIAHASAKYQTRVQYFPFFSPHENNIYINTAKIIFCLFRCTWIHTHTHTHVYMCVTHVCVCVCECECVCVCVCLCVCEERGRTLIMTSLFLDKKFFLHHISKLF